MISKSNGKKQLSVLLFGLILVLMAACNSGETSSSSKNNDNNKPAAGITTDTINLGTSPVGTSANAIGNGLASVISTKSEVKATVMPYSGVNGWVPLLNSGEIGLGADSAIDLIWAFNGDKEAGYEEANSNMRLLVRGNYLSATGLVVREDSGIKSVADLKGKRVSSDYPGSSVARKIVEAALYANGLTWDDVTPVPVPTIVAGIEALQDNRLDATFALVPSTPIMMEAHNATGLYGFDFIDNQDPSKLDQIPEANTSEILNRLPIAEMTSVEPAGYLTEKTIGIRYPNYMVSSTHLSDETIYEIMETLWEHYEELHPVHPWLASWNPEQMFDPNPHVPYHSGAVQFFKDKGLWNDEVDKLQEELLKDAS